MSIVTFAFFVFMAVTVIIYYACPMRVRVWVPLAASIVFYVWAGGIWLFLVMAAMSLLAWGFVVLREKYPKKDRLILTATVAALVCVLFAFKENTFFIQNINYFLHALGVGRSIPTPQWAAPLGISYFTLMLVSYVLDVSYGLSPVERNPLKVLMFTCYFPQMTAGPFTRYNQINAGLFTGHRFDYENFCFGLQRITWGLFKKLVVADRLAAYVAEIYGNHSEYGGIGAFFAAVCYTLQLYADFSGLMDIVIGASQLLGIKLPENFRQPFFSRSVSEIWRKWHITLGLWVKDYVMYPLQKSLLTKFGDALRKKFGKRAGKKLILYMAMFATWFCTGFWHSGMWKYIFGAGLFFYAIIVFGEIMQPYFCKLLEALKINTEARGWHLFQSARSFCLFAFSLSFVRGESLADSMAFWKGGFSKLASRPALNALMGLLAANKLDLAVIAVGLAAILTVSVLSLNGSVRKKIAAQNVAFRWLIYLSLVLSVLVFGAYGEGYDASDFIYGTF